jgi:hypothetical protein
MGVATQGAKVCLSPDGAGVQTDFEGARGIRSERLTALAARDSETKFSGTRYEASRRESERG